jgi:chaperonin GroES
LETLLALLGVDNIADILPQERLDAISNEALRDHDIDWESMKDWRTKMQKGIDLASLVKEEKTYPFEKASNVRYPLITTAALQFNARAYPAVVPATEPVKTKVYGRDEGGGKAARAERVSQHMSWQLSAQVEEWEETVDELLTVLPIVGTVVKKIWHDPVIGRARCRNIKPAAFVINASAQTLEDAPRVGEILSLYPVEIKTRRLSGIFRDVDYVEDTGDDKEKVQEFIEQHRRIDLDEDGYPEPYIVTVHKKSQKVARIVADFTESDIVAAGGRILQIRRGSYFVPYHFLPPINGGFFGTGLGFLLGDISEAINTIINMLVDAGHMASRGGGFIGSEFRIKGGAEQFRPGEWRLTQSRGADVKNAIVPLTFPGPDATLFALLGLLIDAGKEVASVKDILTGDVGGKQMTATTTMALIEQGLAVFTAAYKRIFRSLKREFKLFAQINAQTVSIEAYSAFHDLKHPETGEVVPIDPKSDYSMADMDIEPVADPASVTRMQEAAKAQIVMQLAEMGLVDRNEAAERVLQSANIPETEALLPKPDPMQQMMMQAQAQAAQADLVLKAVAIEQARAEVERTRSETLKNVTDAASAEHSARLDELALMLKAVSDGLKQSVGSGPGRMAGSPGNGGGGNGPAVHVAGPAIIGDPRLLGGQPVAGGGQGGGFAM